MSRRRPQPSCRAMNQVGIETDLGGGAGETDRTTAAPGGITIRRNVPVLVVCRSRTRLPPAWKSRFPRRSFASRRSAPRTGYTILTDWLRPQRAPQRFASLRSAPLRFSPPRGSTAHQPCSGGWVGIDLSHAFTPASKTRVRIKSGATPGIMKPRKGETLESPCRNPLKRSTCEGVIFIAYCGRVRRSPSGPSQQTAFSAGEPMEIEPVTWRKRCLSPFSAAW
jgi:hypothetical protein